MITREQYLEILLKSICKTHHINDDAYKTGFMDGAHVADNSVLNTFEKWIKYAIKHDLFHKKEFQNEKRIIEDFKLWLGV